MALPASVSIAEVIFASVSTKSPMWRGGSEPGGSNSRSLLGDCALGDSMVLNVCDDQVFVAVLLKVSQP